MNKKELRTHLKSERGRISAEVRAENDRAILEHFLGWEVYKKQQRIMAYLSFGTEIDTWPIVYQMLDHGKQVFVPVVDKAAHRIVPTEFSSETELGTGDFGIKEPQAKEVIEPALLDMVIVPGLAFTPQGYRLGYGGGYYDRFLPTTQAVRVGLCYTRFVRSLPVEDWDEPVGCIITEQGILQEKPSF